MQGARHKMRLQVRRVSGSVGSKLALGAIAMALVAGAIGATSIVGLGEVGGAVDRTGKSVVMLADMNAASTATMEFLDQRAPDAAERARAAAARLDGTIHAVDLDEEEGAFVRTAVDRFSAGLGALLDAAMRLEEAQSAALARLETLRARGAEVQELGFDKADEITDEVDTIADDLGAARLGIQQMAGVRADTLRTLSSLKSHALTGEQRFVIAAGAGLGGMLPVVKKLAAGEPAGDIAAKLAALAGKTGEASDLLARVRDAATPVAATSARDRAIALLETAANDSEEVLRLQAKAADALSYQQQNRGLLRAKALETSRMGASFSSVVAGLAAETFQYRGNPKPETAALIEAGLKRAGVLAGEMEKSGLEGIAAEVDGFAAAFADLLVATTDLRAAADEARDASLAASAAIGDLASVFAATSGRAGEIVATLVIAAVAAALVLAGLTAVGLHRAIAVPLAGITGAMRRLAAGDTEVEVPGGGRRDEIGAMAGAVLVFRDNEVERRRLAEAAEAETAAQMERQRRLEDLVDHFRGEVTTLLAAFDEDAAQLERKATGLAEVAGGASGRASRAAEATEAATGSVQTVAAATEELESSIREIGRQTSSAVEVVGRTAVNAQAAGERVSRLARSAEEIESVVALIRSIAEQTNLLALNATIEAARAGEAGKGFAVVAGEVKSLAGQTARATADIARQVEAIQETTGSAVEAIQVIMAEMSEVDRFTAAIAAAVEEQGAATGEISRNVNAAAEGTATVGESVAALQRAVSRTTASSDEVLGLSRNVTGRARDLSAVVDGFLADVAAA